MGADAQKVFGNLIDPFRIKSTAIKAVSGKSGESWLGNGGGKGDTPQASAIPSAPEMGGATSAEKAKIRKKTKTILTSPLTGDEYYGASAPTLLGSGDATKKTTLG